MGSPDEAVVETPARFWQDLHGAVCAPCRSYEEIDDALRAWLALVSAGRDRFLQDEDDVARCSRCLLASPLCAGGGGDEEEDQGGGGIRDYVRTQIVHSLLQEDEAAALHAIANYLLLAGRGDEAVFRQMIEAGCFARLVELVQGRRGDDRRLHRLLLELLYEMARIERVRAADLLHVDDAFVCYLFQIVEDLADDADDDDDPYHFPVIRVLLVLNEQYMVAATAAAVEPVSPAAPLTNRVVKVLSTSGRRYRTFGENIILLLNRATETALQLLILKLLYLLFTTAATYEYFYTNDLRVLVDVIVRNLLDLPNEAAALRHTYLRVLSPLLAHTQLNQPPQYKRDEILRVLAVLCGAGNAHFAPADETTLRLVDRVARVSWLADDPAAPRLLLPLPAPAPAEPAPAPAPASTPASPTGTTATDAAASSSGSVRTSSSTMGGTAVSVAASTVTAATTGSSSGSSSSSTDDALDADRRQVVNKFLGISLSAADGRESRSSVADVAAVTEKPGVKTPSRRVEQQHGGDDDDDDGDEEEEAAEEQDEWEKDDNWDIDDSWERDDDKTEDDWGPAGDRSRRTIPAVVPDESAVRPPPRRRKHPLPALPPERRARAKRVVPAVPTHRHGVPVKVPVKPPPPPPPPQHHHGHHAAHHHHPHHYQQAAEAAAGAALAGGHGATGTAAAAAAAGVGAKTAEAHHPTATAAAAAAVAAHNVQHQQHVGSGGAVKKLPPKAPPPRRAGRLKQAASSANLHQAAVESSG